MTQPDDLIDALEPVVQVFRDLGIQHFIGGSIASSFHGATRSTMDVDLVCDMKESQVAPFLSRFTEGFYVSQTAVENAVRSKSCFNLIHLPTAFKVDVFVSRARPFDIDSMRRSTLEKIGTTKTLEVPIATAEDSIVSKLEWYRFTEEPSERQWNDVMRLVRLLGERLDITYLRQAADAVGVRDLLDRLLSQG
ncbi:MAG: hypothetical protein ACKN9U_09225 [Pirellulaceae bacterium]